MPGTAATRLLGSVLSASSRSLQPLSPAPIRTSERVIREVMNLSIVMGLSIWSSGAAESSIVRLT